MINLETFNCTGCTACYNVCPHKAIKMVEDSEGFKFPQIDMEKCTNCGLCEKVCIPSSGYVKQPFETLAFGVKNKNLEERKQSQSGGAFYILAKHILSKGGVVYGSLIDEGFVVRHARASTEEETKAFRGSKYVQSDLGDIFQSVKQDVQSGTPVLFSGTPCQVAGLKAYLRKDYENLLLVDLICHGVPSPKVWADYIEWQQKRKKKLITQAEFRDRSLPWGKSAEALWFDKKKKKFDIYAKIFYSRNAQRKSCYECLFANTERLSDITIGDFWGIENIKSEFRDDYGVSAVILNSETGKRIWKEVNEQVEYFQCKIEDLMFRNPQLYQSATRPVSMEIFWQDYNKGFAFIAKKYGDNNLKGKLKRLIKRILGRI